MKKIYLLRHGQTDFNVNGILQGSNVDADLNEVGRKQAHAFFKRYSHLPFKKIYTSDLNRTFESIKAFADLGIPVEKHSGLNEIDYGDIDGKGSSRGEDSQYQQLVKKWNSGDISCKLPGGESPEEVKERQEEFLRLLLSDKDEDLVLVCMHGRALRILLTNLLGLPLSDMYRFSHSNMCLYVLSYNKGKICLEKQNDTSHLDLVLPSYSGDLAAK